MLHIFYLTPDTSLKVNTTIYFTEQVVYMELASHDQILFKETV